MRQELPAGGNALGIDGVFLKEARDPIGNGRCKDERHQEVVAVGNLRNEEDGREGGLHHSGHEPRHTHQHKIGDRHQAGPEQIERIGHHEAGHSAHEQRGAEGSAHTAARVGEGHGKDLQQQYQQEEEGNGPLPLQEELKRRISAEIQVLRPVQQRAQEIVTLSVQRREQEDEKPQRYGRQEPLHIGILEPSQAVFHGQGGMDEIEGREAAEHAQKHVEGNILHSKGRNGSGKGALFSQNQIAHQRG